MKRFAMLTAAAVALAACAGGEEEASLPTISEITVSTDLAAVSNAQAVNYWQRLDADLETALANEFVAQIAADGAILKVDVDEIALTNAYQSGFAGENARLSGRVDLVDQRDASLGSYDVAATASEAAIFMPAGTTAISPDSADFYAALVQAFARGVAETVNGAAASGS